MTNRNVASGLESFYYISNASPSSAAYTKCMKNAGQGRMPLYFFFHVQRVPIKNISTSNIFLLIFVFSMHPHLQFMNFIFKRPRLWRPGFIAGTKKNKYSPKGHIKINQSHRCQQCLKRQQDTKHDLTFDASKLRSNCYFHFHFGLFSLHSCFFKKCFCLPIHQPSLL